MGCRPTCRVAPEGLWYTRSAWTTRPTPDDPLHAEYHSEDDVLEVAGRLGLPHGWLGRVRAWLADRYDKQLTIADQLRWWRQGLNAPPA